MELLIMSKLLINLANGKTKQINIAGLEIEDIIAQIKKKKKVKPKVEYKELVEVFEHKKCIVFKFKNDITLNYSLVTNKFLEKVNIGEIQFLKSKSIRNTDLSDILSHIIECSKEKWIKTFFKIADETDLCPFRNRSSAKKIELLSKIPAIQDMDNYYFLIEIISKKTFKNSLSDIGIDSWFIENISKDYRLFGFYNEYARSKKEKNTELFRYLWSEYKLGWVQSLINLSGDLLKKGYDIKGIAEYLCRGVVNQGLPPLINIFDGGESLYENNDVHEEINGISFDTYSLNLLMEYLENQIDDNFEKYPKHLKTAIDLSIYRKNVNESKVIENKFKYLNLNKFEFSGDDYCIVAPKSVQDILREGSFLKHCIANYADAVAYGRTIVVFMRKKSNPDLPLVTIQIRGKKNFSIALARGGRNRYVTHNESLFINEYNKHLRTLK